MKNHPHTRYATIGVVVGAFLGAVSLMTIQGTSLSADVLSREQQVVAPGQFRLSPWQVRMDQRRHAATVKPVPVSASSAAARPSTVSDTNCIVATDVSVQLQLTLQDLLQTTANSAGILSSVRTRSASILQKYCAEPIAVPTSDAAQYLEPWESNYCFRFEDDAQRYNDCNLSTFRRLRYLPR